MSDAQVHAFLRIFVFVPALCAAFASTILALCAVSVRKTFMDEDDLGATVDPAATPTCWIRSRRRCARRWRSRPCPAR